MREWGSGGIPGGQRSCPGRGREGSTKGQTIFLEAASGLSGAWPWAVASALCVRPPGVLAGFLGGQASLSECRMLCGPPGSLVWPVGVGNGGLVRPGRPEAPVSPLVMGSEAGPAPGSRRR